MMHKIQVGISSCLLGDPVRYDGGHQFHAYIVNTLGHYFQFKPFCPEVAVGLGVPPQPIRLQFHNDEIRCVDRQDSSIDYTQALQHSAHEQQQTHLGLCGYILKSASPSCGFNDTKVWRNKSFEAIGTGIYATTMIQNNPNLPIEDEIGLEDAQRRVNFLQRVLARYRWLSMENKGLSGRALMEFHRRHKLTLMAHDQNTCRSLGQVVAQASHGSLAADAAEYFDAFMSALKNEASRGSHVNVLQYIQGYLKNQLRSDEKVKLRRRFDSYLAGDIPLIFVKTYLLHFFHQFPDPYIANSYYMDLSQPENQLAQL